MKKEIEWINIKEKLPPMHANFLVCGFEISGATLRKCTDIAYYSIDDRRWTFAKEKGMSIEFWAELPELPIY